MFIFYTLAQSAGSHYDQGTSAQADHIAVLFLTETCCCVTIMLHLDLQGYVRYNNKVEAELVK
jgi:hypothetical protein